MYSLLNTLTCFTIILFLGLGQCQIAGAEKNNITLKNRDWEVTVDTATLGVRAQIAESFGFALSSPQSEHYRTGSISQDKNQLAWDLPEQGLAFKLELIRNELQIEITAKKPEAFTFPVIDQTPFLKALILPNWEGIYAPLAEPKWRNALSKLTFDTLEGLTIPFFGLDLGNYKLTYMITNRFNNKVSFKLDADKLQTRFTHYFTRNNKVKTYGFVIRLDQSTSPVQPAIAFRNHLIKNGTFVSMKEKVKKVPKAQRLLGAVHGYLWGDLRMTFSDVLSKNRWHRYWGPLCREIVRQSESGNPSIGKRIQETMDRQSWQELVKLANLKHSYWYIESVVAQGLSKLLSRPDFYKPEYFQAVELPATLVQQASKRNLTPAQAFAVNSQLLHASFPGYIRKPEEWGDGYSIRMLKELKKAGIDRAKLTHDLWDFGMIDYRPQLAAEADRMGFLLGPYDTYNSIHHPKFYGKGNSWPMAQYNLKLYQEGGIVLENGKLKKGFGRRGKRLSPAAARPWVEKRVNRIIKQTPYNYYFIDCDAWGEVYDDYSPLHPATQQEDVNQRMSRIQWISDTHQLVVGSEGGSSYAAPFVHVIEGTVSTAFGKWNDPDFDNHKSKYYLGRYFPNTGPEVYLKPVPLKERFIFFRYDPRFRLPLNEVVFHDSFVSTNHWSSGTYKFENIRDIVELTSLLYMTPPMYHFNLSEFKKRKQAIKRYYDFFSPLHRAVGFEAMTDFSWISADRLVQKTEFGEQLELIANFKTVEVTYQQHQIPGKTILSIWKKTGLTTRYTPSAIDH